MDLGGLAAHNINHGPYESRPCSFVENQRTESFSLFEVNCAVTLCAANLDGDLVATTSTGEMTAAAR